MFVKLDKKKGKIGQIHLVSVITDTKCLCLSDVQMRYLILVFTLNLFFLVTYICLLGESCSVDGKKSLHAFTDHIGIRTDLELELRLHEL
ncbi:unnamed protein product [Cuscuta campestris]|uniref:Uncharacterized protein n=1 Tax=Cuscuta campestris TaxID=132261 RepID=A0A484LUN4_9ASTE|nr:unnamed protein product [Cuscuta campestris]